MFWDPLEHLPGDRRVLLKAFASLLLEHNRGVNLISRADEEQVFDHHILHSLTLSFKRFPSGSTVVDWGTGGGLPAIPLAIVFPECQFIAVDATRKKVNAVRAIGRALRLDNLDTWHGRAEQFSGKLDYSISRATAPLSDLWSWHKRAATPGADEDGCWAHGLLCLKGGDLTEEISRARRIYPGLEVVIYRIDELYEASYFAQKVILECRRSDELQRRENR
ncbi:MAG: RsmG family class I SAM-dependent methyltransferase [Rhodothermales bacterium]